MKKLILPLILFSFIIVSCETSDKDKDAGPNKPVKVLPGSNINKIYVDYTGRVWIATNSGLASYFNEIWTKYEEDLVVSDVSLRDIAYQKTTYGDELWFASQNGAIVAGYDIDAISSATTYSKENSLILDKNVIAVCLDTADARWFGTPSGISVYKGSDWYNFATDTLLQENFLTDIESDTKGRVYVSTLGYGVLRYSFKVDAISGASRYEKTWSGLPSDNINTIFIDDTLQWFGTDHGVAVHSVYETKEGWTLYTKNNGLISNDVTAIFKDSAGQMWFGTKSGISVLSDNGWVSHSTNTGLISNDINCIAEDPQGRIWVGTSSGISVQNGINWINYD